MDHPKSLRDQTMFITGGSRGIGEAIALRAARDGANIILAAKTTEPHPKLPGTIYSVAESIESIGGKALPLKVDVRYEEEIQKAVEKGVKQFGGIDILVNNASAISLTGTLETSAKKFDLMHQINARATFLTSQACIPYLKKSKSPHILTLSPPLNLSPAWFKNFCAYTMSKYGMSMCVLGMSEEFKEQRIAINALWPKTIIATAAMKIVGVDGRYGRTPEIMADAAYAILTASEFQTGKFFIDEEILQLGGLNDFSKYAVDSECALRGDLFLD